MLERPDELRTFYDETLGPLGGLPVDEAGGAPGPHAKLLDTLDAFLAHGGNLSATAHALDLHRNTLSYRLDKIASLTGLDPRSFDDAIQIRLSLLLRSLRGDPGGLCKCPRAEHPRGKSVGQTPDVFAQVDRPA